MAALPKLLLISNSTVYGYGYLDHERVAKNFAIGLADELKLEIEPTRILRCAIQQSDICAPCTTSREFFLRKSGLRAPSRRPQLLQPRLRSLNPLAS